MNYMDKKKITILFIVGKYGPTSITLEMADRLRKENINLEVASFKESKSIDSENYEIDVVPVGAKKFLDVKGILTLGKCIRQVRPDIVHIHRTTSGFWASIISLLFEQISVVKTEHANQKFYTIPQNVIHTLIHAFSDHLVCNSHNTYRNLYDVQKFAVGDNWEVIYNGVDIDRIETAVNRSSPIDEEKIRGRAVVGSVGRLIEQKNYHRLIQAFSLVVRKFPDSHLVLIGDGDKYSQLEREVVAQDLRDHVTLAGECARDDVYAALHRFDLFVMPSLGEGFCNAVVEAMAAGKPVVASDISTLREVVGEEAVYVDPRQPEDMAAGIIRMLNKEEPYLSEKGKDMKTRTSNNYSLHKTAKSYLEKYKNIAKIN